VGGRRGRAAPDPERPVFRIVVEAADGGRESLFEAGIDDIVVLRH
jgi:hypothetical protein